MHSHEFRASLKEGRFTSLGSYPRFYVTADGACLCVACAREEREQISLAILHRDERGGWCVVGVEINWEDPNLHCDHCNARIESAYAEPEAL